MQQPSTKIDFCFPYTLLTVYQYKSFTTTFFNSYQLMGSHPLTQMKSNHHLAALHLLSTKTMCKAYRRLVPLIPLLNFDS